MLSSSILCLALTLYHEARGEPLRGQEAVAEVVINRSLSRNKSVCQVVYEPNQFSWAKKASRTPPKNETFEKCEQVAKKILTGEKPSHTNGAEYFYSTTIKVPNKATNRTRIGNHVFFNQE